MNSKLLPYSLIRIFSMITNGEIQVPAFQRPFVWTKHAVIKLLESVYLGRPIGLIFLWEAAIGNVKFADPTLTGFPVAPQLQTVKYVIDGAHRLISLYNCFHQTEFKKPSVFEIAFDLDSAKFMPIDKAESKGHFIPLWLALSSDALPVLLRDLQELDNTDDRINSLIKLQAQFQNYEVATMTLYDSNINDVISTYEALNMSGIRLSNDDVVRANTMRSIKGFKVVFKPIKTKPNTFAVNLLPRELQQPFEDGRPQPVPPHPVAELTVSGTKYNVHWIKLPERFANMQPELEKGIKKEYSEYRRSA